MDALKNFIIAIADTILQQVTEQVKKTIEAVNSMRPLPTFNYAPTTGCKSSHKHATTESLRGSDEVREIIQPERSGQSHERNRDPRLGKAPDKSSRLDKPARTSYAEKAVAHDHGTEAVQCVERGPQALPKQCDPVHEEPREEECSTEIVATIAYGYAKGIIRMEGPDASDTTGLDSRVGDCVAVPTMIIDDREGPHFSLRHNDPLLVKLKVANAPVRWILIDTESSVDILTQDCLKKLKHLGREIVNLTGVIRLPLRFGDKSKAQNLDVPTAYNVILGRPTLHRVKVITTSYLLQFQYEADDGGVGKLQGDQQIARECYLVNIRWLLEHSSERGLAEQLPSDKKSRITAPPH
ncbi:LOW QUALITY PROTEIN: hypothetical protein Cgig2_002636 [Carnegiea gigantea]|uniref:Uncharacterized protein n=1 Tax=Carnegiea gigantea TaxID=171969 RepID=A0A9Q1JF11_9CARY|nr:LOW QUALITY PROTEIN: hypothetical protein Cgig2_002636 [Carnegiea gigantea]